MVFSRNTLFPALVGLLLLTLAATGCTTRPGGRKGPHTAPLPELWPDGDDLSTGRSGCDPLSGAAEPGGTFTVAVYDSVQPRRAPVPHNRSERLVFASLYETLVEVDCDGTVGPGLAEHWACTSDSTTWVFTLRADARFWDGSRVTSEEIRQAWIANAGCPRAPDRTSPWAWLNTASGSISCPDAQRLAIQLPEPQGQFPLMLAHPATAVAVKRSGWTWPVGSGPGRLRASTPAPLPELECRPNPHHPQAPAWKSLTFLVQPGADPRDAVNSGVDLALIQDLPSVRYFTEAPGYTATALPWARLYLLVCAPDQNPTGTERWVNPVGRLRPDRDLTRVAARAWPDIVLPSGERQDCPQLTGPVALAGAARRGWHLDRLQLDGDALGFVDSDPGARELAHRLAALADDRVRPVGLPADALGFTLDWQMAGAWVVAVDQIFPTGCLQLAALLGRTAWLQKAALTHPAGGAENLVQAQQLSDAPFDPGRNLTRQGLVTPLALTHSWLVSRGRLGGLTLTFDGLPRLSGLGQASEGAPIP